MAKDANNNKDVKNKKHFFKDFKTELKKVIWPTPKQIVNNTIAVITIVLITAVIVFVLDFVFDILNEQGINRLKSNIRNTTVVENVEEENNEETSNSEATGEGEVQVEDVQTENSEENSEENNASTEEVQ